ncbi:uncharacterized protein LOC113564525 isoform X2 [Drosophila erecta]|uniref:uncharacterized protein LOC113564525 isoform X2 n=1 Tax=Drosophila erecta TaxID=7220 RepID=UPI000F063E93|nr:uncharacterized protein LOC113564525 isoform X2 [Drosophila erecta]
MPEPNTNPSSNTNKVDAEDSLDLASNSIIHMDETIYNMMIDMERESIETLASAAALNTRIGELLQVYQEAMAEEKALRAELRFIGNLQNQADLEDFQ